MRREILYLHADSFTSMSACAREVTAILEATECDDDFCAEHGKLASPELNRGCRRKNVVIRANPKQREELESELEPIRQQWRVKVEDVA